MPKKVLSIDEQVEKFEKIMHIADEAAASDDLDRRIGAITLYAGIVDFFTIQLARLIEQVVIKSQLVAGGPLRSIPTTTAHFYNKRINTRKIVNDIKEAFLPFRASCIGSALDAEQANILVNTLIEKTNEFLDYRNAIIHHVGSPSMVFQQWEKVCDKAIYAYKDFVSAHMELFKVLQPYGFSKEEYHHFNIINDILQWHL